MAAKDIIYSKDARERVLKGVKKLADAIRPTMGPKGRAVWIEQGFGDPIVTMDGVSVARQVELKDPHENMGARIVIQASAETNDKAGDGTSTAIILAYELMKRAMPHLKKDANPILIHRGMEKAMECVNRLLAGNKIDVVENAQLESIAKISSRDDEIAKAVAEAMEKSGRDGIVTVDDSSEVGIRLDYTEGLQFKGGLVSPYFITDAKRMRAVWEKDVPILVYDGSITAVWEIQGILEALLESGRKQLCMICDNVMDEALAVAVTNKIKGIFYCLCIKAPAFGDVRRDFMRDIAIQTGAQFISKETGRVIKEVKLEDLGHADKVECYRDHTVIVHGKGEKKAMEKRAEQLKAQLDDTENDLDKTILRERLANFEGGVSVIKVGGNTEAEQREKKYRTEDAIAAARAAMEEGILPGCGVAYLRAAVELKKVRFENKHEDIGRKILLESLQTNVRVIASNAGLSPDKIVRRTLDNRGKGYDWGYDALHETFTRLADAQVIDPVKVERIAMESAVAAAGMFLKLEVSMVDDIPEHLRGMPPMSIMAPGGGGVPGYAPADEQ